MVWPLKYPLRKPYGAWLFTTGGLLAVGLLGSVWVERLWGVNLPEEGLRILLASAVVVGLIPALIVANRQKPPEPGDLDDPSW